MERTHVRDVFAKIGEKIKLQGWIHTLRDQGGIIFILLRDKTGIIQTIATKKAGEVFETASNLTLESVVTIEGLVKAEAQAPEGIEVAIETLEVLSLAAAELPIPVVYEKSGEEPEVSKRFDWRWIDLRRPERQKIFEVWTALEKGFRKYYDEHGFTQLYTPSFMTAPSEGGSEVFEVSYFDRKAYLAQSPQFYKQMAMASGLERVFITGPVYRAEPSFTTRHMTEFTGWDFEISFIDSHHDVMAIEEELIVSGFEQVRKDLGLQIKEPIIPFPKITMKEAKEKLKAADIKSEKDFDVTPEEERELCRIIKEETGHDFVFLIDWPIDGRPFYHMRYEDNPGLTKSFDLLYKGVEVITGAQREHRPEVLEKQAGEKGVELASIKDYLDFFRFGCPPHGGVGMGPGRFVMQLLDLPSIKEATFLPRDVKRLTP